MNKIIDEHFVPDNGLSIKYYIDQGDFSGVHHLIRYEWAELVLSDVDGLQNVLDIACGSGYGTYKIAKKYPNLSLVGADYDMNAVNDASIKYQLSNLKYVVGDVTAWKETIGDIMLDCIISFDTIEHVKHREIMMENIVKYLNPNGILLLSTPCGNSNNVLSPEWEHHKIEYSSASLYDFMSRYFKVILRPDDLSLPHLELFSILDDSDVDYLLKMNPLICKEPIKVENPYT